MNKEEALDLLQHLILQLRDNKQLQSDSRLMQDWIAKQTHLTNSIALFNPDDIAWLDTNYALWFNKEIKPFVPESMSP